MTKQLVNTESEKPLHLETKCLQFYEMCYITPDVCQICLYFTFYSQFQIEALNLSLDKQNELITIKSQTHLCIFSQQ